MKTVSTVVASALALFLSLSATPLMGQEYGASVVTSSCQVLDEIMAIPAREIPTGLLADAEGIVVIPNLLKGGFVVGVRHGRGVVVIRDEKGGWKAPAFITVTGGSIGYQIGVQAIDLILVFKSRNSINRLMQGKFTIGADAAAAAGPVGRQAAAATDAALRAEIYSYSRSRGLFAGVSIDGSVLQVDHNATAVYYASVGTSITELQPGQQVIVPPSAARLLERLAAYTTAPTTVPVATEVVPSSAIVPAAGEGNPESQAARRQLVDSARQLHSFLDDSWKRYLALPAEVYSGAQSPNVDAVRQSLARFDNVATNPQYRPLAQRPEFQATHEWLRKYASALQSQRYSPTLALPPPPR
jgi:lipid-binding SYLF domain-containing protein